MSLLAQIAGIFILILIGVLLGWMLRFLSRDARRRGLSDMQMSLICLACILFFPEGLILYLILRPAPPILRDESCKQVPSPPQSRILTKTQPARFNRRNSLHAGL